MNSSARAIEASTYSAQHLAPDGHAFLEQSVVVSHIFALLLVAAGVISRQSTKNHALAERRQLLQLTAPPSPSRTWSCRRRRYRTCVRTSACRHHPPAELCASARISN